MKKLSTRLGFESLEAREVPTVFSAFNSATGELRVMIDNAGVGPAQNAFVAFNNRGEVTVNSTAVASNGRPVAASAVRSVRVIGSDLDNVISVTGVNTAAFRGLDGKVSVEGRGGRDTIDGSQFADTLDGGGDNDFIRGRDGRDALLGGAGNDVLEGGNQDDAIYGEGGNDTLNGQEGNDTIFGGAGNDNLYGGGGNDRFDGGPGVDYCLDDLQSESVVNVEYRRRLR